MWFVTFSHKLMLFINKEALFNITIFILFWIFTIYFLLYSGVRTGWARSGARFIPAFSSGVLGQLNTNFPFVFALTCPLTCPPLSASPFFMMDLGVGTSCTRPTLFLSLTLLVIFFYFRPFHLDLTIPGD